MPPRHRDLQLVISYDFSTALLQLIIQCHMYYFWPSLMNHTVTHPLYQEGDAFAVDWIYSYILARLERKIFRREVIRFENLTENMSTLSDLGLINININNDNPTKVSSAVTRLPEIPSSRPSD